MKRTHFHSAEGVWRGHPDKIADQISDALVDAHLQEDAASKVACETLVKGNLVVVGGEVTSKAKIDIDHIVRETLKRIGYALPQDVLRADTAEIITRITGQSPAFTEAVAGKQRQEKVASDQGILYGFAAAESPTAMPLPMYYVQRIVQAFDEARTNGRLPYLRPDGKCQVSIAYDESANIDYIHSVVFSAQHTPNVDPERVREDVRDILGEILEPNLLRDHTAFSVNQFGAFVNGGPEYDCGVTGRKLLIDTYGSSARHGGGAFSGKDPSKLDRSGAYAARWIAKNIVAAGLAKQCEIELVYAIGHEQPISISAKTQGTEHYSLEDIERAIRTVFDLRPPAIVDALHLRQLHIYEKLAFGGHMGREDLKVPWEETQHIKALFDAVHHA